MPAKCYGTELFIWLTMSSSAARKSGRMCGVGQWRKRSRTLVWMMNVNLVQYDQRHCQFYCPQSWYTRFSQKTIKGLAINSKSMKANFHVTSQISLEAFAISPSFKRCRSLTALQSIANALLFRKKLVRFMIYNFVANLILNIQTSCLYCSCHQHIFQLLRSLYL